MEENRLLRVYSDWEIVSKIGQGSFGSVYEMKRDHFGKVEKAALKVISIPQNGSDIDDLYSEGYDDASITDHFKSYLADIVKEYTLMAELKGHTNVVYCDDIRYIPHDDSFGWDIYIKMELLTPMIKRMELLCAEAEIIKLGRDICTALVLCKEKGIVHRDIKPQNIFVADTGDYKLGDFGIAKAADRTVSGTKIGTYNYMAPEVYNYQPYGSTADIYSLGLVLYWLLNEHRLPFLPLPPQTMSMREMESARQRRFSGEAIPAPKNGSAALKAIVLKACAYNPKDRYQSAQEMLEALHAAGTPGKAVPAHMLAPVQAEPDVQPTPAPVQPTPVVTPAPVVPDYEDDTDERTVRLSWGTKPKEPEVVAVSPVVEMPVVPVVPVEEPVIPVISQKNSVQKTKKKKLWPWLVAAGVLVIAVLAVLYINSLYVTVLVPRKIEYANGVDIKFGYDKKGQLTTITTIYSPQEKIKQQHWYDDEGNRYLVVNYENGEEINRWEFTFQDGYATELEITVISEDGSENVKRLVYERNAKGDLLTSEVYDADGELMQTHVYSYDRAGHCIKRTENYISSGSTMVSEYTYDQKGNLMVYKKWFNKFQTVNYAFFYDGDGRVIRRDSVSGENETTTTNYIYDDNGNLVQVECEGQILCTIIYEEKKMRQTIYDRLEEYIADWIASKLIGLE